MKNLNIPIGSIAIMGLLAFTASAIAEHGSINSALGTPLHGQAVGVDRSIPLDSGTRWVNVTGGEKVRFVLGGQSFDWLFDTHLSTPVFDLSDIAPKGFIDRSLKVYVSPDPSSMG